jgi:hypothetical protein
LCLLGYIQPRQEKHDRLLPSCSGDGRQDANHITFYTAHLPSRNPANSGNLSKTIFPYPKSISFPYSSILPVVFVASRCSPMESAYGVSAYGVKELGQSQILRSFSLRQHKHRLSHGAYLRGVKINKPIITLIYNTHF